MMVSSATGLGKTFVLTTALTERLAKDALLEMVEAVRDLERGGGGGGSVLSGDLGVVPIGAILQLLQVENQSGVLVCRSRAGPRQVEGEERQLRLRIHHHMWKRRDPPP